VISYANQSIKIENKDIDIKNAVKFDKETFINLPDNAMIKSSAGTEFSILHKSDDILKDLYCGVKERLSKQYPDITFQKFLTLRYAFDLVIDNVSGAVKEFVSSEGSVINGNKIPAGVYVQLRHNNVAWIVNREIRIEGFSFEKLSGDKNIFFAGKSKTRGRIFTGTVAVDNFTISGHVADTPVKEFNCTWENVQAGPETGMSFDSDFNIVFAGLSSGTVYGFSDRLNYVFSHFTEYDGEGVLKKIQDDKGLVYYGETGNLNRQIIQRPIKWNDILLNDNDVLIIKKEKGALPQDPERIQYALYLKDSRRIKIFSGRKEYLIKRFPYGATFYGNFNPESFVIVEDSVFDSGAGSIKAGKDSLVNFYSTGAVKLIRFNGTIILSVLNKNIKFREYIMFHDNGKFKEGVLAGDININIWGKDATVEGDSVIRLSSDGEIETVTTRDNQDKINIIYAPEIGE
jgi:hypothetical protein